NITQPNSLPLAQQSSEIYLMDIRNFTWVYTFEVQKTTEHGPINTTIKIVITTICAMVKTFIGHLLFDDLC
ncbi:2624_t:CDS:2, partial [Funneliformis mosseae]